MEVSHTLKWWQKDIIYQVYPRSFKDSTGNGIGDLPGIIEKADYFKWLGVKAVWLSPVYPSPMKDFGYDISDYRAIHPTLGTMENLDHLLHELHKREIKLIMDLVPNHTSDAHEWFMEARKSKDNPKRDWYIWADPSDDGGPPNNWRSEFGGSAWELDSHTGQYYCHSFLKEQPDLNWYNPEVREAMWDVMRFWLKKGVDGFRVDVLWYLIKDKLLRNNPPNPEWHEGMPDHDKLIAAFSNDQPEVHDVVEEMRRVVDEFTDRLIIGEIYLPVDKLVMYYGKEPNAGVHLPFNFHLVSTEWDAQQINQLVSTYEGALPAEGWPNWVLGNHDKARIKARIGKDQLFNAALLLLTLRGTPTMYYGDEIGMEDVEIPSEKIQDPREFREPGIGVGRDPQRTPMQWDGSKNAGFSNDEPWLPVGSDYQTNNVKNLSDKPHELLLFYRKLIALRQKEPALHGGSYHPVGVKDQLMCYKRQYKETAFIIALNMGNTDISFTHSNPIHGVVEIASNHKRVGEKIKSPLHVKGNEGLLIRIS